MRSNIRDIQLPARSRRQYPTLALLVASAAIGLQGTALAWLPGTYPAAPARMHSLGFSVDNQNRNDVIAFWHAVYQASEGYQSRIGWNGNYTGSNGTVSRTFADDVQRRLNYFRAMCGTPADARINTDSTIFVNAADPHKPAGSIRKSDAAQAAALMLIRNYDPTTGRNPAFDHNPPSSITAWSPAAWNANAQSNLAFGMFGPGAITEYMIEEYSSSTAVSAWNSLVGHRRWCLLPEATDFATGDQPGESATRPPTNVLYISQKSSEIRPTPAPVFVSYPPAGYFPAQLNSRYWSLSMDDADFSAATVRMTDSTGNTVPISTVQTNSNFGDPALLWEVSGEAAAKAVYADQSFHVTVSGIAGTGVPTSHSYTVTLINPDRIASDQSISGSAVAVANKTTSYTFTPPAAAEAVRLTAFRIKPATWKEGAEKSPKANVADYTAANYPLIANMAQKAGFGTLSGSYAFNLTFPTSYDLIARSVPDQSFELTRLILPKSKAKLQFIYRRGYMTTGSSLAVEASSDGGVTWKALGNPITGKSNTRFDDGNSVASFSLPKSVQPIQIRFRYFAKTGAAIYTHPAAPTAPTGIFIDDICVKNCDWLEARKTTTLAKSTASYAFSTRNAGARLSAGDRWALALGTKLGNRWFPYGPIKPITVTAR